MPLLYRFLCKLGVDIDRQSKQVEFFKGLVEQVTEMRRGEKVYLSRWEINVSVEVSPV
jgi:hypothetical protein